MEAIAIASEFGTCDMSTLEDRKIRDMLMNDQGEWAKHGSFESDFCVGTIYLKNRLQMKIKGLAKGNFSYSCAGPPDLRQSYSGSALPWPNPKFAFSKGSQSGWVEVDQSGKFSIKFIQPNAYYNGNDLVPPTIYISNGGDRVAVKVAEPISNRSLHSLPNRPSRSSGR